MEYNVYPPAHISESYNCKCNDDMYRLPEISENWLCPKCRQLIDIKVPIKSHDYLCNRIHPDQLKIGDQITLDAQNIHLILRINSEDDKTSIALENYGHRTFSNNDFLMLINGSANP